MLLATILHIAGLVCFALAAGAVPVPRINMIGLGLFLFFLPTVLIT